MGRAAARPAPVYYFVSPRLVGPPSRPTLSGRSANAPALDQIDDREQHDRADYGNDQETRSAPSPPSRTGWRSGCRRPNRHNRPQYSRDPIEASRFITMLASQPATPPTIKRQSIPPSDPPVFRTPRAHPSKRELRRCVPSARNRGPTGAIGRERGGRAAARSVLELALVEIAVVLDAGHAEALHARAVDRALPPGELLESEVVALEHLVDVSSPPLTAATTSALRRTTQRLVDGDGRSATVSGSPRGPITCAGRIF